MPGDQPADNRRVVLDPQIVIWTDALWNQPASTTFKPTQGEFMVGWTTDQVAFSRDIWARRVAPNGTLSDWFNVASVPSETMEGPSIAFSPPDDEYLFAYTNWYQGTGGFADVQSRRVAWDGSVMSGVLTVSPRSAQHIHPSIAYNSGDDEYLETYSNQWHSGLLDLYAQRVRAADSVLLSWSAVASDAVLSRLYSTVAYHPDAYGGNGGYLIAYLTSPSTGGSSVSYKMTQSDLSDLFTNPEIEVSNGAGVQYDPGLDVGANGFLISWWENTPAGPQVRARRISADGNPLGPPEAFAVSGLYADLPTDPKLSVAYTHQQSFLVLWNHKIALPPVDDIHGVLVSENLDSTIGVEFELNGGVETIFGPAASCSPGSECLIAYSWWNTSNHDVAGRIIHLLSIFSDGFESGDHSAWSVVLP